MKADQTGTVDAGLAEQCHRELEHPLALRIKYGFNRDYE